MAAKIKKYTQLNFNYIMKIIYGFAAFIFNVFGTSILSAFILPYVSTGVFIIIAIVYILILTYLFKRWLDKQPIDL